MSFSEEYKQLRDGSRGRVARERAGGVPESVIQSLWFEQRLPNDGLKTDEGCSVRVVFPGWWNRSEGPDFTGAQLEMNGRLRTGDVEIHLDHSGWKQHGHNTDPRYDNVLLEVVLADTPAKEPARTSQGRRVPCLLLRKYLDGDVQDVAALSAEDYPGNVCTAPGRCAELVRERGVEPLCGLLNLAGEWRLLCRARAHMEHMERVGADQVIYEAVLEACGFSRYKRQFRYVARHLPYERARQLGRDDPHLLEVALLQLAGLLPEELVKEDEAPNHLKRLENLRASRLPGLRPLPITWPRTGVRPNNYPERRFGGAARFLGRTAQEGLADTISRHWEGDSKPIERRRAFEELFPRAMGFWANHCTWTGKKLAKPIAPLGAARIRSIIGNVFVAAGLAQARRARDRRYEERVLEFFGVLPKEPANRILKAMEVRVFGEGVRPKLTFRGQQGLLQMYQDWCHFNPTCRNCSAISILRR